MNGGVDDRIGHGTQIPLEIDESHERVLVKVAFVDHDALGLCALSGKFSANASFTSNSSAPTPPHRPDSAHHRRCDRRSGSQKPHRRTGMQRRFSTKNKSNQDNKFVQGTHRNIGPMMINISWRCPAGGCNIETCLQDSYC